MLTASARIGETTSEPFCRSWSGSECLDGGVNQFRSPLGYQIQNTIFTVTLLRDMTGAIQGVGAILRDVSAKWEEQR